jgi:hypothetical protein
MPNKGATMEDFMLRQKEHAQQEIGLSNHMLSAHYWTCEIVVVL